MKRQMIFPLVVVAALGLAVGSGTFASEEVIEQRWAVLVGVNDYAELDDLQFCRKDAEALAKQLVQVGFPRENVFLLTDGATDAKYRPNKANIEDWIRKVLRSAEDADLVLISFSGHGVHLDGKTYLCPTEARLDDPGGTMIELPTVYGNLERCRAKRKLLWVDACRNDPRPRGMKSATAHAKSAAGLVESLESTPKGIMTLASCAKDQVSWEAQEFGHGVFIHYLLEGLSGNADRQERGNRDSKVSMLELYNYANIKTKRFTLNERPSVQTPELFGRFTGDFDIVEIPSEVSRPEITNSIGMKLKLIPAGDFLMGSARSRQELVRLFGLDEDDAKYFTVEQPQHCVRITKPFYLGVTEVTQGQWEAVMGTGTRPWSGKTYMKEGSDYAASFVSWDEAVEFCKKLSSKEGVTYRLPTEAEWEYACRGGTTTVYHFGDDASGLGEYAWFDDNADAVGEEYAHRVGQKKANPLGLYDMHGNVCEWCDDRFDSDYYENSPTDDPTGPTTGSLRVSRGGGWLAGAWRCRSASRDRSSPGYRSLCGGFRVASVPVDVSGR